MISQKFLLNICVVSYIFGHLLCVNHGLPNPRQANTFNAACKEIFDIYGLLEEYSRISHILKSNFESKSLSPREYMQLHTFKCFPNTQSF